MEDKDDLVLSFKELKRQMENLRRAAEAEAMDDPFTSSEILRDPLSSLDDFRKGKITADAWPRYA
jgi:hypothetical protein